MVMCCASSCVEDEVPELESITGTIDLSGFIPAPKTGETPIKTFPRDFGEGGVFSGEVSWEPDHDVFRQTTVYTARVTLRPAAGYFFLHTTQYGIRIAHAGSKSINSLSDPDNLDESLWEGDIIFLETDASPLFGDPAVYDSAVDMIRKCVGEPSLYVRLNPGAETVELNEKTDAGVQGLLLSRTNCPAELTIDGSSNARVIQLEGSNSGSSPIITVGSGVTLTLKNITFRGLSSNTAPLIRVNSGGKLVLDRGVVIRGNRNLLGDGGGVYVDEGGALDKRQGSIIYGYDAEVMEDENYAEGSGYAIYTGHGMCVNSTVDTNSSLSVSAQGETDSYGSPWGINMPDTPAAIMDLLSMYSSFGPKTGKLLTLVMGSDKVVSFDGDFTGFTFTKETGPTELILDGSHKEMDLTGSPCGKPLISVGDGVTVRLCNITFKGLRRGDNDDSDDNSAPLFMVEGGGRLLLEDDAKIMDNNFLNLIPGRPDADLDGGGVYVSTGGRLSMRSGAVISGHQVKAHGGGVFVALGGSFIMTDGVISGNRANYGGGVFAYQGSTFSKTGGIIYGNVAGDGTTPEADDLKNEASFGEGGGHAVRYGGVRGRDKTADKSINLNSGDSTNWDWFSPEQ